MISATLCVFAKLIWLSSLDRLRARLRPRGGSRSDCDTQAAAIAGFGGEFGGGLADDGFVDRLHDAVLHQHVLEFVHGDRGRDDALAGIVVDLLGQAPVVAGLNRSGAYSSTVMRRSSACCTMLSRGTK